MYIALKLWISKLVRRCFYSLGIHLGKMTFGIFLIFTSLVSSGQNPGWQPPANSEFTYSANVIASIKLDTIISNNVDDRIAFFVGNEIRGLSQPVQIAPGKYVHFISLYSNANQENLTVKVYHKSTNIVYEILIPFLFKVQTIFGSVDTPYELNIYSENNAPLGLLTVPAQQTMQGLPFNDLDLAKYLIQPDPYPVEWSFVPNSNLKVSLVGSILKVQGIEGFNGQTQLVVKAKEINNQVSTIQEVQTNLTFSITPLYTAPAWNKIPDQSILRGGKFDIINLHDYEIQYGGPAISYSYLPLIVEKVPPETKPNWQLGEITRSNMSITARINFTPKYTFNHQEDIMGIFVKDEVRGIAKKDSSSGLYFMTVTGSILPGDSMTFKFYSGAMKKIFSRKSNFTYEPYGIQGNTDVPIIIDFAPLIPLIPSDPIPDGIAFMDVSIVDPTFIGAMCFDIFAKDALYPEYLKDVTNVKFSVLNQEGATIDCGQQILPVGLIDFNVNYHASINSNVLKWKTSFETNNDYFIVQRNINGTGFEDIATIEGKGNISLTSDYTYTDSEIKTSGNYIYRLKQVDYNREYKYSKMISIDLELEKKFSMSVHPNPANNSVQILANDFYGSKIEVSIFNSLGQRVVHILENSLTDEIFEKRMDCSTFEKGMYHVILEAGNLRLSQNLIILR
jgi:hypothetical protein